MPAIQVWSGRQRDEKLTAVRVGSGVRHRKNSFRVVFQFWVKFIRKFVARSASSRAGGVAALNHESIDDAMENHAVVKFLLRELYEIVHGIGYLLFEQPDREVAHSGFKTRVCSWFHLSIVAFLM